jgi:CheY-like chemotaxis protein
MEQMRVLIVDDNKEVRAVVRDYLPDCANEIYECADGGDALELYRQYSPDWVLMDWEMPRMNGITAVREIVGEFPEANICMVTAFEDEEIRRDAFSAGVVGFVLKDNLYEIEDLLLKSLPQ